MLRRQNPPKTNKKNPQNIQYPTSRKPRLRHTSSLMYDHYHHPIIAVMFNKLALRQLYVFFFLFPPRSRVFRKKCHLLVVLKSSSEQGNKIAEIPC